MHQIEQRKETDLERPVGVRWIEGRSDGVHDESQQRVIRQFVEALLFEGLVEFQASPRTAENVAWGDFDPIFDHRIEFRAGDKSYVCFGTTKSFDRVRVAEGSLRSLERGRLRDVTIAELILSLQLEPPSKQRLLDELSQTLSLCRWNRGNLTHHLAPRRNLGFDQLESAIFEGHQYHPSFKTRMGFSLENHQEYGPEAGNRFQLEFLAVRRGKVRQALPKEEATFWRAELGDAAYEALTIRLRHLSGSWDAYSLVPVHPFQLQALKRKGLQRAIETREVIALGCAGDQYRATQSLRTLANSSHPHKANVKLPLDIFCTSCQRNFRKHFVCTAPALSKWLVSLVECDPFLQEKGHVQLLSEYAGIVWVPEAEEEVPDSRRREIDGMQGMLGAIFRESISSLLQVGEAAVPFTALALVESDGRPFFADWLDAYGVKAWVDRLIEVTLIPIWHMLVHHGIAFESHSQNLILVHRNGWPERIVLRDFHDDTEFVPHFLREPDRVPDFASIDPYFATVPDDEGYRMASTEDLRELFMDTVYVFNLAEVSFLLERYFSFHEQDFWQLVQVHLRAYATSGTTAQSRIDQVACDMPEIVVESLLKKTIMGGGTLEFFEHRIKNPLSE